MCIVDQYTGSPFVRFPFRTISVKDCTFYSSIELLSFIQVATILNLSILTSGAIMANAVKKPEFTMKIRRSSLKLIIRVIYDINLYEPCFLNFGRLPRLDRSSLVLLDDTHSGYR